MVVTISTGENPTIPAPGGGSMAWIRARADLPGDRHWGDYLWHTGPFLRLTVDKVTVEKVAWS